VFNPKNPTWFGFFEVKISETCAASAKQDLIREF